MARLAEEADLRKRWAGCPTANREALLASLDFATRILRRRVKLLDDRIASGDLDEEEVKDVICEMVRRHLADPVRREQLEDAEFEYDLSWLKGGIYPTADELALLAPAVAKARPRYRSVRPTAGLAP